MCIFGYKFVKLFIFVCMKSIYIIFFLAFSIHLKAQEVIKVKREDNRFLFYQLQKKNDTIIKNQTDQFVIKFPDSLKANLQLNIENGLFKVIDKSLFTYQLLYVKGMKYSHTKPDSLFNTLLEGNCRPDKKIKISVYNTLNQKVLLTNTFLTR